MQTNLFIQNGKKNWTQKKGKRPVCLWLWPFQGHRIWGPGPWQDDDCWKTLRSGATLPWRYCSNQTSEGLLSSQQSLGPQRTETGSQTPSWRSPWNYPRLSGENLTRSYVREGLSQKPFRSLEGAPLHILPTLTTRPRWEVVFPTEC